MTEAEIDSRKFVELLLTEFPELREEAQECQGLVHLQVMEFALFTDRACKHGDWKTADRCLRLADSLLRLGDYEISNAIYVSYLECLPRKGEIHDRLRKMMTADLQRVGGPFLWQTIRDANERPRRIPVPVRRNVSFRALCGN
jgi:hypothetical protein